MITTLEALGLNVGHICQCGAAYHFDFLFKDNVEWASGLEHFTRWLDKHECEFVKATPPPAQVLPY